MIVDHHVD